MMAIGFANFGYEIFSHFFIGGPIQPYVFYICKQYATDLSMKLHTELGRL